MKTKLTKGKFYGSAKYRLSRGAPAETLYEMIEEYDITKEEIDRYIASQKITKIVSQTLFASKEQKEIIYNTLDQKFIEEHDKLVVFLRGENITFYEYHDGVYKLLHDIEMENMVDDLMAQQGLLDYRTKRKYIKDTVSRIGSLLCRTPKKHFIDDDVYKNKWYLNLKNGLLDMDTYILHSHTPDYFCTVQVPFNYDPTAECPEFEAFIDKVSDHKASTAQMIQEMYGYGISDGNKSHKVFYLYGDTARNGKSTTAKILCGLIGMGNVSTLSLAQMAGETSTILTSIIGKQINFSDELSSKYIDSSRLTAMSSEGMIEINPKYKPSFMYRVKAKFIVACNDLPKFQDAQGMKHRMISIPFRVQIPVNDRISRYDEILLEKEGSGILNWAIKGAAILKKEGNFSINDESREDIQDNLYDSNSVYAFLDSEYDFGEGYTTTIKAKDMYGDAGDKPTMYRLYCHKIGVRPKPFHSFSGEVKRFANETGKMKYTRKDNDRCYTGLQEKDYNIKNF